MDNWLIYDALPRMNGGACRVLLALGLFRNFQTGECYPSIPRLAEITGMTERAVQRGIKELEGLGVLTVQYTKGGRPKRGTVKTNSYQFVEYAPPKNGDSQVTLTQNKGDSRVRVNGDTGVTRTYQRNKPSKNASHSSRRALRFDEADAATARWMLELIREIQPGFKQPDLAKWANAIRLMREHDGRADDDIRDLFQCVNRDPFWRGNVLSPAKLRQQWDQLDIKLRNRPHGIHRKGTSQTRAGRRPPCGVRSESPARPRERYGCSDADWLPPAADMSGSAAHLPESAPQLGAG